MVKKLDLQSEEFKTNERVLKQFDHSLIQECYEKGGAVIFVDSRAQTALKDVDSRLQNIAYDIKTATNYEAKRARMCYQFPWLIATLASQEWADIVFPGDPESLEKLWDAIFKCCSVYDEDPIASWTDKINRNNERAKLLTNLQLKKLVYTNSLGTNLQIGLPPQHVWLSTGKKMSNKDKEIVCNMPSEEIFTSPYFRQTEGIVYASRPLVLDGKIVEGLCLTFKDGEVTSVKADTNEDVIKHFIYTRKNANFLGEVALVDYNSPISQSGILFYKTIFDENAACHLALGDSFPRTALDGSNLTKEQLLERGLNRSTVHQDFMIGTPDLNIIGIDEDNQEYQVFENGNFVLDKKIK